MRSGGRCARRTPSLGGEEFLLVLPGTDIAGAHALAERVRAAIEETGVDVGAAAPYPVTLSIGVAALGEGQSAEALVMAADEALYEAKAAAATGSSGRHPASSQRGRKD
jgi:diguanylate cyclase (GGDEF)-like protein